MGFFLGRDNGEGSFKKKGEHLRYPQKLGVVS